MGRLNLHLVLTCLIGLFAHFHCSANAIISNPQQFFLTRDEVIHETPYSLRPSVDTIDAYINETAEVTLYSLQIRGILTITIEKENLIIQTEDITPIYLGENVSFYLKVNTPGEYTISINSSLEGTYRGCVIIEE